MLTIERLEDRCLASANVATLFPGQDDAAHGVRLAMDAQKNIYVQAYHVEILPGGWAEVYNPLQHDVVISTDMTPQAVVDHEVEIFANFGGDKWVPKLAATDSVVSVFIPEANGNVDIVKSMDHGLTFDNPSLLIDFSKPVVQPLVNLPAPVGLQPDLTGQATSVAVNLGPVATVLPDKVDVAAVAFIDNTVVSVLAETSDFVDWSYVNLMTPAATKMV